MKPDPMKNGPLTWTSKLQTLPYCDIPLLFINCITQSWEVHHHADDSWWESCIRMPFWWWIWATSWICLVAHMVKNPPAIRQTWVWSLGWEDPLEEGMASTPVFLPRESPRTEEPGRLHSPWGHKESDTTEWLSVAQHIQGWSLSECRRVCSLGSTHRHAVPYVGDPSTCSEP